MKATLIIPARDEMETIGDVVRAVRAVFVGEIVVVDNGSTDATAERGIEAGAHVIAEPVAGYGRACMAGVAAAAVDTEVFVFMDGDGSDWPEDIASLLAAVANGADLALAVRRGEGVERGSIAPAATFGNWLSGSLIGWLWGRRLHDLSPLKAVRADTLRLVDPVDRTYGWTLELLASAVALKLKVVEARAGYRKRAGGKSKVSGQLAPSVRAGGRILVTLARVWWRRPDFTRAGAALGLLAGMVSLGAFMAWLATASPSSSGVYAAALLVAWPVLLVGVLSGVAAGAAAQRAGAGLFRTRSRRRR